MSARDPSGRGERGALVFFPGLILVIFSIATSPHSDVASWRSPDGVLVAACIVYLGLSGLNLLFHRGEGLAYLGFFLGALALFSAQESDHHRHFRYRSYARGCIANQASIMNTVHRWESEGERSLPDPSSLDLDTTGRIASATGLPPVTQDETNARLSVGSTILRDFIKEVDIFLCPLQVHDLGGVESARKASPSVHYTWKRKKSGTEGEEASQDEVICHLHRKASPRNLNSPHVPHRSGFR